MKLTDMIKKAKQVTKMDDIPGDVEKVLDEKCPNCDRQMRLFKPCCGAQNGYKGCNCGYKVVL